jgi:hypothetical protein
MSTTIDPTDNHIKRKTPTHEPLVLRLSGRTLQKEALSQLIFFIVLASFTWSLSEALKMLGADDAGPKTSCILMRDVEKQVLPDTLYPA